MNVKKANLYVISTFMAVLLVLMIVGNIVATSFDGLLTVYLGRYGESGTKALSTDYASDEELLATERATARQIAEEGTVLFKNVNAALPLSAGSKVTLFSQSSVSWIGGTTSGSDSAYSDYDLKYALGSVNVEVNPTVWDFYQATGKKRGSSGSNGYALNETAWSEVSAATGSSFAAYSDAAIVVIGRTNGEGSDQPSDMSKYDGTADEIYMELSSTERELIRGVCGAGFGKVIVLINTNVPLQMDFLMDETMAIDACLMCAPTGNNGIEGLARVIAGEANPSGHLVDTWVYDNWSAPSTQNLGDNRFVNEDGSLTKYSYLNYVEGVYVGYRYYETRYEDVVMGTANAGAYDYSATVAFPFGFGLSYTDFVWSDYQQSEKDGLITVQLKVKNNGTVAGKDAVGVYFQSPYTDYDRENRVEKPAVQLAAFTKTPMLQPGASTTVTLTFDAADVMKSYDYTNARGYILEASDDYYITAAQDAHQAVNNILSAKGYQNLAQAGGGTPAADASMVSRYAVKTAPDLTQDKATGTVVTNQFDDASLAGTVYLTRSNWAMMENGGLTFATGSQSGVSTASFSDAEGTVRTCIMPEGMNQQLRAEGWEASGRPAEMDDNSEAVIGAENGLVAANLIGKSFDDPQWEPLIQQMKVSEMHGLFNQAGWSTKQVDSIQLLPTECTDGPSGLGQFVGNWSSFHWPSEVLLATTWNVTLAEEMGKLVGEDGIRTGTPGWYAPAMNIHRSSFGGRAGEYYSEDGLLSGKMGAAEVAGAQEKGMFVFIKHFVINDQDTNRNGVSVWTNEQALREIYLKPFETTVKDGNATGVMDAQNRIGARLCKGSWALLTQVLRNEWGFEGSVITDYTGDGGAIAEQCLAAGTDLLLSSSALKLPDTKAMRVRHALQEASHRTAYIVANSLAMSSLVDTSDYNPGIPMYRILLIAADIAVGLLIIILMSYAIIAYRKDKKNRSVKVS